MKPRVGFAGVGWIGRTRMRALAQSGSIVPAALADPSPGALAAAAADAPGAEAVETFEELLRLPLDAVVIATPSALHAPQAIAALERGLAVFCQKPLARSAAETAEVIRAARQADRLLAVDMSYRHTRAMQTVRELVVRGELGTVFAAELVFHNAYGPDKPWFFDAELSGGGCLIDLGIHLVDLAMWTLEFPTVVRTSGSLYAGGARVCHGDGAVEDFATAEMELAGGASVRLACSWNLPAGCDAVISAAFYGTQGGAVFRNVNGSFHDFEAVRFRGTSYEQLVSPPDAWGGRAAVAWGDRLSQDRSFDPEIENTVSAAAVLDAVYGR